jgi:L-alanine-DL-glutamate epimerase-like enolase superfamily enzyme
MRIAADAARTRPLLKVKLGGAGDVARIAAVRRGAPDATLIVDANEAWRADTARENLAACEDAGVALIEQPFPAGDDVALDHIHTAIPICADESFHDRGSFDAIAERYQAINIKLDKTGGLTEALQVARMARARGRRGRLRRSRRPAAARGGPRAGAAVCGESRVAAGRGAVGIVVATWRGEAGGLTYQK